MVPRGLTWAGLTGHGVLLDVRADRAGVVTGLVDPPVGPLAKQNPAGGGRRHDQNFNYTPFSSTRSFPLTAPEQRKRKDSIISGGADEKVHLEHLCGEQRTQTHHLKTRLSQSPITATQMSLMPTAGRRWNHSGKKMKKVFLRSAAQETHRNKPWASW